VQYLAQLGAEVDVRRNDEVTPDEARGYDGVLLSPGPGTPEEAGVCMAIVRECAGDVPIFGVCLGHQAIAARYHSLVIEQSTLPDCLEVTAWTQDEAGHIDEIMGVRHKSLDIEGVQFHPESILTEHGHDMLRNFLQR